MKRKDVRAERVSIFSDKRIEAASLLIQVRAIAFAPVQPGYPSKLMQQETAN